MRQYKTYCAALVATLLLAGCATFNNVEPPQSLNESVVYAGAVLQSVQQTAIAQYQYMSKEQATEVHKAIEQAEALRTQVVALLLVDKQAQAETKLQRLQNQLALIQQLLNRYGSQK